MNKLVLCGVAVLVLLSVSTASAQDNQPAERARQRVEQPERTGRDRIQDLSPDERARLRERWRTMSEQERAEFRAKMQERSAGAGRQADAPSQERLIATQRTRLEQDHRAAVGELQAIKLLAIKEGAKETAEALTQLISRHEERHKQQLQRLEQRLKAGREQPAQRRTGATDSGTQQQVQRRSRPAATADQPASGEQRRRNREGESRPRQNQ